MLLKKRLIITGLLSTFCTSNIIYSDELNSSDPTNSNNPVQAPTTPTATTPPVLLAPNASSKPLPEPAKTGSPVSQAAKLTPSSPQQITLSPKPVAIALPSTSLDQSEFNSLLHGSDLEGWTVHEGRQEAWSRNGEIVSCQGTGGGWLRTDGIYSDFHLKFDYRLAAGANTGLGIRTPATGNPTFNGIELQLLDDTSPKYANLRPDQYTGSLYYHAAPTQKTNLKPVGEWNSCEVICRGDELIVLLNDVLVNQVNLAKPAKQAETDKQKTWQLAKRPPQGHIALQSSSAKIDFKNLKLKDLTVKTSSGVKFVELITGEGESLSTPKTMTVHYVGQLLDGTRFGDTRDLGDPVTVSVDGVIDGWKHGLAGMKVGGRRRLIVPPEMAYGSQGVANLIPPGATLVFEVELCDFER